MPNRERKRVPDDRSDILKGSLPKSPPAHLWDTENLTMDMVGLLACTQGEKIACFVRHLDFGSSSRCKRKPVLRSTDS